jgi:hypothetical protein
LVEAGFVTLASLATTTDIPLHLPSSVSLTEAKGAITIISVIWHALAIFAVRDILLHIFSTEWMEQFRRSGKLVLRETDIVSRMTTGYVDQITHFMSRKASLSFRLAFVASLLLLAVNGLGPSALTVNDVSLQYSTTIQVANLTLTSNLQNNGADLLAPDRASLITRLEQLENTIYGFRGEQNNFLVPWPPSDLISDNETLRYQSDVIFYNFSCSWKVPSNVDLSNGVRTDDKDWDVFVQGLGPSLPGVLDASKCRS